ncbi:MAG: strawberry notch C-terminal domain-containing protein [Leptolyngbyaceae cyanobacterium bins.302]|nr:strawberry notch C-terminal domain-containing protein [Leptolyngbyaceae cyanobacterium bins.302]
MSDRLKEALIWAFHSFLLQGGSYNRINEARRQAEEVLREAIPPGSPLTKLVDEAMEAAVVRVAPLLIQQSDTTHQAYDRLVNLLEHQPTLSVRSSTSVLQQAYSTPIPIAYLASTLAGITLETTVYEPTAGNGALLITANPQKVIANELNGDRFTELATRGYHQLTQRDASSYRPTKQVDRVICNPPFGSVRDLAGQVQRFAIPGNRRGTTQIDQAIAFRALEAMKDDGRAVLILGGKLGEDEERRSNRYNSIETRGFFYALYQQYNVTQHFSIWGNLYRKQGAGFPIDVIVIAGRGQSQQTLPAARVPTIYKSFDALKERLPDEPIHQQTGNDSGLREVSSDLETRRTRQSISLSSQDASRDRTTEPTGLRSPDVPSSSMDDPDLDDHNWGQSTPGSPTIGSSLKGVISSGATGTVRGLPNAGTPAPVVVDAGVGRNTAAPQRNLQDQISIEQSKTEFSDRHPSSRFTDSAAVDRGTQPDDPPGLGEGTDLWDGITASTTYPQRIQSMAPLEPENLTPDSQPLHAAYLPRSQGRSPGTLIPTNMATAAQLALDKLEQQQGDIDEFVRQRLGYESKEELWKYLYAEQIDAVALAFHQRDRGKVFLNGDQTGNGKGRFGASNIVDAINQGYIPVFVTQKPNLYTSMLTDLADIGKPGVRPFMTNNNLSLTSSDGQRLRTGSPAEQDAEMLRIMQQGNLGLAYNAVFTTYSQLQTVNDGKEPLRREFFRAIAPQAIFIFDEAHEAGGSISDTAWKSNSAAPDRAEFVRELVDRSAGAVFMSATATKDPAVMDLYARRSDAAEAVSNLSSLQRTLKDGGIPLQQMMATKFVASGQLLRRERSFEGVSFEAKVVPVNRETADSISAIMRSISQFDLAKQKAVKQLSKELKKEAKQLGEDNAIGQVGAKSTNFTSLMHNVIDQGLLCQKAEATVQEAIASIGRGEKPVIAVASTMDAFIGQYAEDNGLTPGDPITITFGDVLGRYLERSRDVVIKNHEGLQTRRRLTDEELGADALAAYDEARELVDNIDLSSIPLSSIDYIRWRLTQEGYQVDEITGRENVIDYTTSGEIGYGRRSSKETTAQAKVDTVGRFNAGDLDVLILNRSGATGINLHASEKFADQRQRHLIVAQAERDINQVMQMLGRVNRFGQVVEPKITLLMSDLPAEKRLGAILSKKMAMLNANTTAARDSALSVSDVVDFMNPYGEEVIGELLEDNPELDAKLAYPTDNLQGESETELISRVTGRIPLLSINEQENLYTLIETETLDLIAQKEAMGESILRAEQLDLDAKVIARMEVIPDTSSIQNEFTGPVYLDVTDTKVPVKPLTQLQVINLVRENLRLEPVKQVDDHDFDQVKHQAKQHARESIDQLRQDLKEYRSHLLQNKFDPYSRDKANDRLKKQLAHVTSLLWKFPPGQPVRVVSPEGNITYGVVAKIWQKGHEGSPAAPTNWRAQILTDNQARTITIPLTRFNRGKENLCITITAQDTNWNGEDIYQAFDLRQAEQRREAQIFSGNLLKAYEKYPNGKFINYSDCQGNIRQGLIMPASFDIQESIRAEPVAFHEPHQVKAFLTDITQNKGSVKTLDELLTIKTQASARLSNGAATGFVLQTPKSGVGDRFSLDQDIMQAAENEFYSVSDRMELIVPADRIDHVLSVVMKDKGHTLSAFDFKDQARDYLGIKLPELEQVSVEPVQETNSLAGEELRGSNTPSSSPIPEPFQGYESEPTIPLILHEPVTDDFSKEPQPMPHLAQIAPPEIQSARAEKNIARFLQQAELLEAVMTGDDFHLRIENTPYIPLVIERHINELYLTHYLSQNGDIFIDSEMVFNIREDGQLQLKEIATQNPFNGGESRGYDRPFAQLFARNILDQCFAEAAKLQWQKQLESLQNSQDITQNLLLDNNDLSLEGVFSEHESNYHSIELEEQTVLFSLNSYEEAKLQLPVLDPTWQTLETQLQQSLEQPVETTAQPSLQDLREWYRQARDIGRSDNHLMKIEQIGKAFRQGQPLSDRDLTAMERDQAKWQEQVWAIANHAKTILSSLGEPLAGGTCFEGKKDYTLFSRDETLYALASGRGIQPTLEDRAVLPQEIFAYGRGIIMKLEQDKIFPEATRVTSVDAERFQRFAKLVETRLHEQNKLISLTQLEQTV